MKQNKSGQLISSLRKKKGLTQADLAARIGVTDKAVSKWENGKGLPDVDLLKPLCDELGISTDEFLSGTIDRKKAEEHRKKKRMADTGLLIAVVIILCGLLIWGINEKRTRDSFLKQEFTKHSYGCITAKSPWDDTDESHYVVWVLEYGRLLYRFEVDSNTLMSDELRERLQSGELNINVHIVSFYTGKQYLEKRGSDNKFIYPALSIELWESE